MDRRQLLKVAAVAPFVRIAEFDEVEVDDGSPLQMGDVVYGEYDGSGGLAMVGSSHHGRTDGSYSVSPLPASVMFMSMYTL